MPKITENWVRVEIRSSEGVFVNQRVNTLMTDNDTIRDINIERNNAFLNAGSITADENQAATFNLELNHRIRNRVSKSE